MTVGVTHIVDISRRSNPRFDDIRYLTLTVTIAYKLVFGIVADSLVLQLRDHPEEDIAALFEQTFAFIRRAHRGAGQCLS